MKLSLDKLDLLNYTSKQVNVFFPDNNNVNLTRYISTFDLAIDRLDYCFKHVKYPENRYNKNGETFFNHLYADHYLMFLWFLSNTLWNKEEDLIGLSKLYYLNKVLHGFDCMYDTALPDIFLVFHGVGTMLGKAKYSNFFVCLQGCTVGAHKGYYPKFGQGVALAANTGIIGNCEIGSGVSISAFTKIFETNIPSQSVVFNKNGTNIIKPTSNSYAQHFFNVDIHSKF